VQLGKEGAAALLASRLSSISQKRKAVCQVVKCACNDTCGRCVALRDGSMHNSPAVLSLSFFLRIYYVLQVYRGQTSVHVTLRDGVSDDEHWNIL
jgi:hypothetical protein